MKTIRFAFMLFAMISFFSCGQNAQLRVGGGDLNFEPCWNTAGSAGAVDEGIQEFIRLGHGAGFFLPHDKAITNEHNEWLPFDAVAYVKSNAPAGFYTIRYNIGQFVELKPNRSAVLTMSLRYLVRDKSKERVIVLLKRYEISPDNPDNKELANSISLFDSFNHDAAANFQTLSKPVSLPSNEFSGKFDFEKYVYFIEVLLWKYSQDNGPVLDRVPSPPAIGAIQLCVGFPPEP